MSERYIRKNRNSFAVVKNSINYGKFNNLEDAVFIRDELIENDWNPDLIEETYHVDGICIVVKVIDDRIHILGKYGQKPSPETIEKLTKMQIRNPNNSRYGLNITRVFDTYVIKKQIAGEEHVFGYYDNLEDAEFVRNYLLDNQWDVSAFPQIQYDEDRDTFRVTEVIDDKIYVLDSFKRESEIDILKVHEDFLNKISKHKFALAQHPHLDELKTKIPELEEKFNIKTADDVWSFENAQGPLNIIFNLTPFQKAVYDAVDDSTFEEIKKSLIRYRSGNFDEKIQKNLDELLKRNLITKNQNRYIKGKQ
jgi:hypothetical protein